LKRALVVCLTLPLLLCACFRSAYYAAWERVGRHKRDILVNRVQAGQEDQREAEAQFLTTLEAFKQVADFEGGDLEDLHRRLQREFERSEARARQVSERIASIEQVAGDLFAEWESEIDQISSPDLRRRSSQTLRETRARYQRLDGALRRAESSMEPVLVAFRDQVLFLKHNLNARAIASLQGSVVEIEGDVDELIAEMRRSIGEAEAFVASMEGGDLGAVFRDGEAVGTWHESRGLRARPNSSAPGRAGGKVPAPQVALVR
jgi:hypothetical protein